MNRLPILLVVVALTACQRGEKADPPATSAPSVEKAVAAPAPSASAPAPTFARYKSGQYIALLERITKSEAMAVMKVTGVRAMTKDDYGMAPMLADEGTRFLVPSLGPDKGGRIMSFSNPEDLAKTKAYYDDLKKTSAALFSWTAVKNNLLLQMNGDMPEKQFRLYENSLDGLASMQAKPAAE